MGNPSVICRTGSSRKKSARAEFEPAFFGSSRVEPNKNPENSARAESSQIFAHFFQRKHKKHPYIQIIFLALLPTSRFVKNLPFVLSIFFPFLQFLMKKRKIFLKRRSRARRLQLGSFEPALARLEPELFRAEPNSNPVLVFRGKQLAG